MASARKDDDKDKRKSDDILTALVGGIAGVGIAALAGYGLYKIIQSTTNSLDINEIGVNFNEWRRPKKLSGDNLDTALALFSKDEVNLPEKAWKRSTGAVDRVLAKLMEEMQEEAKKYEGLVLEKYIKQGSAREGLKVYEADEFDVLLKFRIDGLEYEVEHISRDGFKLLPELARLKVDGSAYQLEKSYPRLYRKGVFTEDNGFMYLNSMNLQEKVFKSIAAAAASRIQRKVTIIEDMEQTECRIYIRTNPPSVNIGLTLTEKVEEHPVTAAIGQFLKFFAEDGLPGRSDNSPRTNYNVTEVDVDVVPGLLLDYDSVPDPTQKGRQMVVPKYAVFKWFTENHRSSSRYTPMPYLFWRICSSGYEKHVMDIALGMQYQDDIITALRLLKLFFLKKKRNYPTEQILTVLRSYHLKHLAFFCILFLRVVNKEKLSGVKEATAYLLRFLWVCLKEERLPHFFHNNCLLVHMFPGYHCDSRELRYNLFDRTSRDSLVQARLSFRRWLEGELSAITDDSSLNTNIVNEFQDFVQSGEYFS